MHVSARFGSVFRKKKTISIQYTIAGGVYVMETVTGIDLFGLFLQLESMENSVMSHAAPSIQRQENDMGACSEQVQSH